MLRQPTSILAWLGLAGLLGCAGTPAPQPGAPAPASASPASLARQAPRAEAARTALRLVGAPYRYGGRTPRGFDCSGLVVYSFARAGLAGLPHSAAALEELSQPVRRSELEPGDLLFFRLEGKKTSHVAIYVGGDAFVHAPSSGKRVEKVSLDHVYWGPRVGRAGRLLP
jgi:cell wall-associated NlpC family hydrolase